jgi:hypothetical protein
MKTRPITRLLVDGGRLQPRLNAFGNFLGFPIRDDDYASSTAQVQALQAIPYEELDLSAPWESFDLRHDLTTKGIRKFVADYQEMLNLPGQQRAEAQRVGKR